MKVFVTHGHTESGDDMPLVVWPQRPSFETVVAAYRDLIPYEFEVFGDSHMGSLISVTEAEVREA